MNVITDKTVIVVTKLGDFWITPKQAEALIAHKINDPQGTFEIEGNQIANSAIDGVLTPEAYTNYHLKRRGGWQCKFQQWHERGQQCAHHMLQRQR